MKRKRNSTASNTQKANKEAVKFGNEEIEEEGRSINEQIEEEGRSINELPESIVGNILGRLTSLSVKRIINCKCVCKSWYKFIFSPEFAKLHFEKAQKSACTLVRTNDPRRVSRTLYLIEPEDELGFDIGHCTCGFGDNEANSHVHIKLDTRFKIPLRDSKMVLYDKLNPKPGARKMRFASLKPKDHNFRIANSCNGLLCLCEPKMNDPVLICNPLTGEYIRLPEAEKPSYYKTWIVSGIGYSPTTNRYKVIRMFNEWRNRWDNLAAEIHILGTGSWKSINGAPSWPSDFKFATYLNGALHWFRVQFEEEIISFDIEKEEFLPIPSRPNQYSMIEKCMDKITMGVLNGCLYICDASRYESFGLWVMKEYGVEESWTNVFKAMPRIDRWPCGVYQPIKYMENGALLMFHSANCLIYRDPARTRFKFLKLRGIQTKLVAISYTPSFLSLKESLMGANVRVQNVKSRCARLNLKEEANSLFMVEEKSEVASSDSHDSTSYEYDAEAEWLFSDDST